MITVDEVLRQDGHVLEVRISVDGASFAFQRHPITKDIFPVVKSGMYVPKPEYKQMMRRVRGIFAGTCDERQEKGP